MKAWFVRHFLSIDARTLGFWRVALAALLLVDLAKRAVELRTWYTDDGLLPREAVEHPSYAWSFFWYAGDVAGVVVGFAFCGLVYIALLVGYRTRLAQVLALVCVISLQHRVQLLTIGADIVVCIMCWWALFLPLGRRFSLDAVVRDLRDAERPAPVSPPAGRRPQTRPAGRDGSPVVSLAVLAVLLQLSAIYFLNALHKDGVTWREGTAIHYVIWLDSMSTPLGVWFRSILTVDASRVLTWGTLVMEAAIAPLILSPIGKPWTRRLAILFIVALHVGIATLVNVGLFTPSMIVFAAVLVTEADWQALTRYFGAQRGLDRTRALFHRLGTVLYTRIELPLARAWGRIGRMGPAWRVFVSTVREGGVLALMVVATIEMLLTNPALPSALRPAERPAWHGPLVGGARLGQSWRMFSPNVADVDRRPVVDAVTRDGRHVDPMKSVWVRRNRNVYWGQYANHIPYRPELHAAFRAWIFAHAAHATRPHDRIVRFTALVRERPSPRPGSVNRPQSTSHVFLTFP